MDNTNIMKGLRICLRAPSCLNCPYYKDPFDDGECVEHLINDISDRLERLELMVESDH